MGTVEKEFRKYPNFKVVEWDGVNDLGKHDEPEKEISEDEKAYLKKNSDFCISVSERIFELLEKRGFEVFDVKRGDGYFIFNMGENAVVHFRVKGFFLKDYKWGMWIHPSNMEKGCTEPVVEVFQQHGDYIDKFKPSRSEPVIEFDRFYVDVLLDKDKEMPCAIDKLVDLMSFMRHHPFLTFVEGPGTKLYGTDRLLTSAFKFFWDRTRFHLKNTRQRFLKWFWKSLVTRRLKKGSNDKCIEKIKLVSFESHMPGFETSYLYDILLWFSNGASIEECSDWYDRYLGRSEIGFGVGDSPYDHFAEVTMIKRGEMSTDMIWLGRKEESERIGRFIENIKNGYLGLGGRFNTLREFLEHHGVIEEDGILSSERWLGHRGENEWNDLDCIYIPFMVAPEDIDVVVNDRNENKDEESK